jgi:hypothetical protein
MAEVMVNRRKRYADRGSIIIITLRWRRRIAADGVIIAVANGNALATYDVDKISFPIEYQHGFVVVLDVVFGVRMDWRSRDGAFSASTRQAASGKRKQDFHWILLGRLA